MLGSSQVSLEDIQKELDVIKTRMDMNEANKLAEASGNNRYEMQMFLNHNTSMRDGKLTVEKFNVICDLLQTINKTLSNHSIYFKLPSNPQHEDNSGRLAFFEAFYHTAIRLRRPYDFRSVMGQDGVGDPDLFIDYLQTLLQKDTTIDSYVPSELESIALEGVPSGTIINLITTLTDEFSNLTASAISGVAPVLNLGKVVAPVLYQNTILPLLRQSFVQSGSPLNNKLTIIGLVDLPQQIDIHVKGDIYKAWNKVFDVFARKDYYSSNEKLPKLNELLDVASPQPKLRSLLEALYETLSKVPGVSNRDASVIVLLIHTAVHYIIHKAMVHAAASGDTVITDLGNLIDHDESFRSLLGLPYVPVFGANNDDPERFFTSAQKIYIQMIGTYWQEVKRAWMHMTHEQKERLRTAVQKKIDERLRMDKTLLTKPKEQPPYSKLLSPKPKNELPLVSLSFMEF